MRFLAVATSAMLRRIFWMFSSCFSYDRSSVRGVLDPVEQLVGLGPEDVQETTEDAHVT